MIDTRESLIKELLEEIYNDMEESCAQGGVEFDHKEAFAYATKEATDFVDRCIAVGKSK